MKRNKKTAIIAVNKKINKNMKHVSFLIDSFQVFGFCFLIAVICCLLSPQKLLAQVEATGNLVTADWLEKNLNNKDVLILDASPPQIYTAQHIPGAISVNLFAFGAKEMSFSEMAFQVAGKRIGGYEYCSGRPAERFIHNCKKQ